MGCRLPTTNLDHNLTCVAESVFYMNMLQPPYQDSHLCSLISCVVNKDFCFKQAAKSKSFSVVIDPAEQTAALLSGHWECYTIATARAQST